MTSLRIQITKGERADRVEILRPTGERFAFDFPKKGPVPHDAIHFFVETSLPLEDAFWGMIADGAAPERVQEIAKAGGHPSAKRAAVPDRGIVELLQAERIVECFEADLWGSPASGDTFRAVVAAACASSFVPAPDLGDEKIAEIRARIAKFTADWRAAPVGAVFSLDYGRG